MNDCKMSDRNGSDAKIRYELDIKDKSTHRDISQQDFDLSTTGRTTDVNEVSMDDGGK